MLREVTNLPSRPAKGPLLTEKTMAMVGSSIVMSGSGCGFFERAEALADGDAGDAGDGDDVADRGLVGVDALEAVEGEELGDLDRLRGCRRACERLTSWPVLQRAVEDATDGQTTEVVGVVEVGDEDLEGAVRGSRRRRNGLEDELEERLEIGARDVRGPWSRCRACRWCR